MTQPDESRQAFERRVRTSWENENPDKAAEGLAHQLELAAIPLPVEFRVQSPVSVQEVRRMRFAGWFYRELVVAGADGLAVGELRGKGIGYMGQAEGDEALAALRGSGHVVETEERVGPLDINDRIVLRAVP